LRARHDGHCERGSARHWHAARRGGGRGRPLGGLRVGARRLRGSPPRLLLPELRLHAHERRVDRAPMRQRLPAALRERDFALLWLATLGSGLATQMIAVAIGWQVYAIRKSAFDLGLIGLLEFAPLPLLALPAGQLADRMPRRLVFAVSLALSTAIAIGLVAVTREGASELWPFLVLAGVTGVAGAIGNPASRSMPPTLVPVELLAGAITIRSIGFQI